MSENPNMEGAAKDAAEGTEKSAKRRTKGMEDVKLSGSTGKKRSAKKRVAPEVERSSEDEDFDDEDSEDEEELAGGKDDYVVNSVVLHDSGMALW